MSSKSAQRAVNDAASAVSRAQQKLAQARRIGGSESIQFAESELASANARLTTAQANLYTQTQKEIARQQEAALKQQAAAQQQAEEAQERILQQERAHQRKLELEAEERRLLEQQRLEEERMARQVDALRQKVEEKQKEIETQKKYFASLSDEELESYIHPNLTEAFTNDLADIKAKMEKTIELQTSCMVLTKQCDELSHTNDEYQDLIKTRKNTIEENQDIIVSIKPTQPPEVKFPKRKMILFPIIGLVIGLIAGGKLAGSIIANTPSLWTESYMIGNSLNYSYDPSTYRMISTVITIAVIVLMAILVFVLYGYSKVKYRNRMKHYKDEEADYKKRKEELEAKNRNIEEEIKNLQEEYDVKQEPVLEKMQELKAQIEEMENEIKDLEADVRSDKSRKILRLKDEIDEKAKYAQEALDDRNIRSKYISE